MKSTFKPPTVASARIIDGSSRRSIFENPSPLQATSNHRDSAADPVEIVDRKVKALLNKLTTEKFDSISNQIIEWANKSEEENDGRTLIQVIRLIFDKATDEATWSEMYARLCRKMMQQISPEVQDDAIRNSEGQPIVGGQLFHKYLLNRCQEDFERGWVAKEPTAAAAAIVLYSDEYYAAQRAKRQGLGLIRFIGELFKLKMLTERIMHECVKKLLGNGGNPGEDEIESLCKLLSTAGFLLDTPKARAPMDEYFSRMKELGKSNNVSSRMQFMLQDVIEFRERKWAARTQVTAPTTSVGVDEAAARDRKDKESHQRTMSMSHRGPRRGGDSDFPGPGPDGWRNLTSGNAYIPPKSGSNGNKGFSLTSSQSSVFSSRSEASRASSNSNMFPMLSQMAGNALQRKRLVLQPRSKPEEDQGAVLSARFDSSGEHTIVSKMTKEDAELKIAEHSKQFFTLRNLDEAEARFSALPTMHHYRLVEMLVGTAAESTASDAQLVADLLVRILSKDLYPAEALLEVFSPLIEILNAIDTPEMRSNIALMIKATSVVSQGTRNSTTRSKIWYKDGSVVLQAQNTQFRVFWGVLTEQSSFFRDMSQPPDRPSVDGCPIVELQDEAIDVEYLLTALFTPTFHTQTPLTLRAIGALIRLGRKYKFRDLVDSAVALLTFENPTTIERLDALATNGESFPHIPTRIVHYEAMFLDVITLAQETGTLSALPCAYYRALVHYTPKQLFDGVPRGDGTQALLAPVDIRRCILARDELSKAQFQESYSYGWLKKWDYDFDCADPAKCTQARLAQLHHYVKNSTPLWMMNRHGPDQNVLCPACYRHATEATNAGRKKLWADLPKLFDLPPWCEL